MENSSLVMHRLFDRLKERCRPVVVDRESSRKSCSNNDICLLIRYYIIIYKSAAG